jgi:hypothetical protein
MFSRHNIRPLGVIFDPRGRSDTSLFVRFAPKATFTNQDVIPVCAENLVRLPPMTTPSASTS